jgi:hypothetical protein
MKRRGRQPGLGSPRQHIRAQQEAPYRSGGRRALAEAFGRQRRRGAHGSDQRNTTAPFFTFTSRARMTSVSETRGRRVVLTEGGNGMASIRQEISIASAAAGYGTRSATITLHAADAEASSSRRQVSGDLRATRPEFVQLGGPRRAIVTVGGTAMQHSLGDPRRRHRSPQRRGRCVRSRRRIPGRVDRRRERARARRYLRAVDGGRAGDDKGRTSPKVATERKWLRRDPC